MLDLKPCPFCGCKDIEIELSHSGESDIPTCQDCFAQGPLDRPAEASAKAWNKRNGESDTVLSRVKELRGSIARDKDRWDISWLLASNAGRDTQRSGGGVDALTEVLRMFDCSFPELKGEEG